jgi:hypothetical protein
MRFQDRTEPAANGLELVGRLGSGDWYFHGIAQYLQGQGRGVAVDDKVMARVDKYAGETSRQGASQSHSTKGHRH